MALTLMNAAANTRETSLGSPSSPHLIAVASGKGGAGKSFLALEIARELAERGLVTVIADLDFRGSSLHQFLGLENHKFFIQDYLQGAVMPSKNTVSLADCLHQTQQQNLYFMPARRKSEIFGIELPSAQQKISMLNALRSIKADFIILDLGAGTHLNVVDFAMFSDTVLFPINAEETSQRNAWGLAAALFSRKIETLLQLYMGARAARSWNDRMRSGAALNIETSMLEDFKLWFRREFAHLAAAQVGVAQAICASIQNTQLAVVLNQARYENDIESSLKLAQKIKLSFGFASVFHGYVRYDDSVWCQIRKSSLPMKKGLSVAVQRDLDRVMMSLFDQLAALEVQKDSRNQFKGNVAFGQRVAHAARNHFVRGGN